MFGGDCCNSPPVYIAFLTSYCFFCVIILPEGR
uniref:Uncharacterized protein n=1 Tax=Siphoviridae sp. ctnN38 TaxID=2826455 RepID=A0A8S5N5U9_9CAUD|nr:MAG TPA: hypothetical protein [Siphoviridae sp. ctnN38]